LVRDILVTGTDTGVGKTVIAAALVKGLRASGVRAIGFKPAETGIDGSGTADSEILHCASAEMTTLAAPLLRLAEPLAPAVAAERAGVSIRPEAIEARVESLRAAGYALVVEGAGGLMAPLAWTEKRSPAPFSEKGAGLLFYTVLDLAERCGLEAVIVARAGLGTLNHVTMTVAMLRSRGVAIRGVILNNANPAASADLAESTNLNALARMLPGVQTVSVPRHANADIIAATVPYLRELIS
jgi:dethiobiotin synthetase